MNRIPLILCVGLLVGGCVSPHKKYQPPSNVKVTASTTKVETGITKAHDAARSARAHTQEAQKHADAISVGSLDILRKIDAIINVAPDNLKSSLWAVKADMIAQQDHETKLHAELTDAYAKQTELDQIQIGQEQDIAVLKTNQAGYENEAQKLANSATAERENLIETQKALLASRFGGFLVKAGAILFLVLVVVLIGLKISGKFTLW